MATSARIGNSHQEVIELAKTPAHRRRDAPFGIDLGSTQPWSSPGQSEGLDPDALSDAFNLLQMAFESEEKLLWCCHGDRKHAPCYTPELLSDLRGFFTLLQNTCSGLDRTSFPFRYLVWESAMPGIWNLGGDLALFSRLIQAGDIEALREYAHACIDCVYRNLTNCDLPYLTIALVQGDALGGGFEAVLSDDIIIAEEHCQFGLPEIMFNMFPGMGAYSLLSRKLSPATARAMILSGRLYSAGELHDLGLIDLVVPTGTGREGLRSFLDRNRRRHHALLSMSRVSQRCNGIDRQELIDVADIWVENAMGISSTDLRRMQRLVQAQTRRCANMATTST